MNISVQPKTVIHITTTLAVYYKAVCSSNSLLNVF